MKRLIITLMAAAFLVFLTSCSQQAEKKAEVAYQLPPMYDSLTLVQYSAAGDSGYQFLDEEKTDQALAAFARQIALIPDGPWGYYNTACVYGRTGEVDLGLEWLKKAVEHGWASSQHMLNDSDLASLREDPRFEAIVAEADSSREVHESIFTRGLPTHPQVPTGLTTVDAINNYYETEKANINRNRRAWASWQYRTARLDLEAKRLALLNSLPPDQRPPDFDEEIERIRAITRFESPYSPWGVVAEGALTEAEQYLAANPTGPYADEANYRAGLAAFCMQRPFDVTSPDWYSSVGAARSYFDRVPPESQWAGAVVAWNIYFDLIDTLLDNDVVEGRIKEFAEKYGEDQPAVQIAAMNFHSDLIKAMWPIPFKATDIDGKEFSLDDYKGKPVLIDFWATWCGPCRGELPYIKEAYKKYHGKGFQIVSVSLDYGDRMTPADYRSWIEENGMSWRHVYDQKDWNSPLVKSFYVYSIPSPLLIGKKGELVAVGEELRQDNLDKALAPLF